MDLGTLGFLLLWILDLGSLILGGLEVWNHLGDYLLALPYLGGFASYHGPDALIGGL